jgi:cell division protein FtsA
MKDRLIAGLDLGSSHIRLAVGQVTYGQDKHPHLNLIAATELPSQGISKGAISSLEDAVSSISSCLEQAERMVGVPLNEATVGIGGTAITSLEAKGVIGVSRSDGEIRAEDVSRAIEAARAFVNPANQEILHILPRSFSVDGQVGIKDPIGMQGIRLEVDTLIVEGLSSHVRNLTNAVFRTGLDISYLVYNPVAVAEAVTSPRQRELGVCILTIGASTTGMSVYENGELLRTVSLPVGADHITSDIAIGLRVSYEAAERIKIMHGTANAEPLPKRGVEIDLLDFGASESEIVSLRYIAEIIEARVEEIFEKTEAELKKIDREGLLPAGVVLTGGGAKLPGIVEVGKRVLRLPCAYAMTTAPSSMPELIQDPAFSTAVGLVLWTYENERREDGKGMSPARGIGIKGSDLLGKLGNPIKKIFKSFIP